MTIESIFEIAVGVGFLFVILIVGAIWVTWDD